MSTTPDISLFSFSHRNTPLDIRDELAFSAEETAQFVPQVRDQLGAEIAVLSTCNRTEFYLFGAQKSWDEMSPFVSSLKEIAVRADVSPLQFRGREAARHLFRVAASIESLALGEDQILAQVKDVHRQILDVEGKSPILDRLYQYAIRVGKRIRTETALCAGAVSISSAAVELAKRIFEDFSTLHVVLVGAGETNESAAEHLKAAGATRFTVVNRGEERGQQLAAKFHGTYRPLDQLEETLKIADVMVFATGSPDFLVTKKDLKKAMRDRSYKSLFMIDISNPRNVDPKVSSVSGVFLFNIDDLEAVIKENLTERQKEIPRAEAIIDEVLTEWDTWMQAMKVRPTIAQLAQFFESIRQQELGRQKGLSEADEELLEQFSKSLVRKLLHNPITFLRSSVEEQNLTPEHIDLVWRLFELDRIQDDDS